VNSSVRPIIKSPLAVDNNMVSTLSCTVDSQTRQPMAQNIPLLQCTCSILLFYLVSTVLEKESTAVRPQPSREAQRER
jgi:hypothetical protein